MTTASPAPETPPTDWARPLFEQQIATLGRLAQAGLKIAVAIEHQTDAVMAGDGAEAAPASQAAPSDPTSDLAKLSIAYARTARAVRLSVMLQTRLIRDLQSYDRRASAGASGKAFLAQWDEETPDQTRQTQIEEIIEDIATADGHDAIEAERLAGEASERLDREDLSALLDSRPVSEVIATICAELGLEPDWPDLAQEAWAQTEINSRNIGWPLADLLAGSTPLNPPPLGEGDREAVEGAFPLRPAGEDSS